MEHCQLLILSTTLLTAYNRIKTDIDIAITQDKIIKIGKGLSSLYIAEETISGKDKLFLPGLIDSHMHTGQQLLKGQVLDEKPIIWSRIMLPFESNMTSEKMTLSAQLAALEMIKGGTTAFLDAGSYCMESAAVVYLESGLRGVLSCSTMDDPSLPPSVRMDAAQALAQTDRLYDGFHGKGNLQVAYSLRALNACSTELIVQAGERARERNTLLQAHMNEYPKEVEGIWERTGMPPYVFLAKLGVLGSHFLGAHSLILTEEEMSLIHAHGVKLCHCPFSNSGKALAPTPQLLAKAIPVGLGSDGAAHGGLSLWREMRIFRSVMQLCHGIPQGSPAIMPAETILKMVLEGGAAALGMENKLGRMEEGFPADLIAIDLNQPHLCPTGNLIHTLLESVEGGDVTDMIVNGKVIMKNRTVLTLDEEKILFQAKAYQKNNR